MTNKERAESARKVLTHFSEIVPNDDDVEVLSRDLICNLQHLLFSEGIDFLSVLESADSHFQRETLEEAQ
jgi:hypothetical protein